jgi:dolichyl-phosphate-mannose-protein mannosyltransferase
MNSLMPTSVGAAARSLLPRFREEPWTWFIALIVGLLHAAVAGRYDAFRNELYFIVCGRHPDFGFVDQPPLVPLIAALTQLLGDNVWLLRLPAIVAAVALVPLTGAFSKLLGGNSTSSWISGLSAGIAPGLIALTTNLGTSTFEPIAWTGFAYLVAQATIKGDRGALLWAGIVAGVAMEAKYGIAIWVIALGTGIAFTAARRVFTWGRFWLAAVLGSIVAAPSVLWQSLHGWPFLAVHANHLATGANFTGTPVRFVSTQILEMNVLLCPLWITGAIAPFFHSNLKPARFLALGFLVVGVSFFIGHGKDYYLFPVYPTMFAVGAVAWANLAPWLRHTWWIAASAVSLILAPVTLPLLDPPALALYLQWTHLAPQPEEVAAVGAPLTQIFSDELGWRALEKQVAQVYRSLDPTERAHAAILTTNYGEAAALEVYGRRDGLPPVLCGQNQYFLWGDHGADENVIIHVNGDPARWRRACQSVEIAANFGAPYVMPYENDRPIFLCRGLRRPLSEIWERLKRYE